MNKSDIRRFQDEAASGYDRVEDAQVATGMAQVAMLAEIALQLAKQREPSEALLNTIDNLRIEIEGLKEQIAAEQRERQSVEEYAETLEKRIEHLEDVLQAQLER